MTQIERLLMVRVAAAVVYLLKRPSSPLWGRRDREGSDRIKAGMVDSALDDFVREGAGPPPEGE